MVTRSKAFGPLVLVANAKTLLTGSPYTLPSGTRKISRIHGVMSADTITVLLDAVITLEIDTVNGPFEFVLPQNVNAAVATGAMIGGAEIDVDIPIPGAGVLNVYATASGAVDFARVGIVFE